jgi:NAD(P)-dependent dehydrogenase (short-subunit alcohol dehydrogenase family)
MSKVVLITGCSTGIGRNLALRLSEAGYCVVATARNAETLGDLPGALKLSLDVTQPDSINQAVTEMIERFGRVDVLVNNAGYALRGALEEIPVEQIQQMFDVNVFGVLRMVQAVAPHMRMQRAGCIINISSIAGKLSMPANGSYSASKFALESLSDALRLELAPFGIQVIVVEPGAIKTHFDETSQRHAKLILSNSVSPYQPLYQLSDQFAASMRQQEPGPEIVSEVIQQAIESPKPKARYHVGISLSGELILHLGDSVWDLALRRMFKVNPSNRNEIAFEKGKQ